MLCPPELASEIADSGIVPAFRDVVVEPPFFTLATEQTKEDGAEDRVEPALGCGQLSGQPGLVPVLPGFDEAAVLHAHH